METKAGLPSLSRDKQHALTETLLIPWARAQLYADLKAKAEFDTLIQAAQGFTVKK